MIDTLFIDDFQVHKTADSRVRAITGLGSPSPSRNVAARASRHGSVDHTEFYEGRVITLEGLTFAAAPAGAWSAFDNLKAKLALGAERRLRFRRSGRTEDEEVAVRVASPVDDGTQPGLNAVFWAVSLFAGDPRIYASAQKSGAYDPTASLSGGGVAVPLTFPLAFSTTTATHLELVNAGNFPTPPVLTIKGPAIDPVLDNDTLGDSITLKAVLGNADQVVVDVALRDVKLNGAERLDLLDVTGTTDWWELAPGTNRLRLRGAGMAAGVSRLSCQFRDARI